ncbi:MAG: DoxX family protein [Gemmatimonadaceae bacterium]
MHTNAALTTWLLQALASLFLAVLFLQSGIDKIIDRRGNLEWLTGHFSKSPLAGTVGPMFLVITILETAAGVLSGVGCVLVVLTHTADVAFWGAVLAAVSLVALFFGQRVAKDYAGAATLVPYFLLALAAIWLLGAPAIAIVRWRSI